jgi:hypothetical protein
MKSLLLSLLLIAAVGCDRNNDPKIKGETVGLRGLKIVVIEECEYFQMRTHNYDIITHKGNCRNPIHQQNTQTP